MATAADFQRAFQVDLPIGEVISKNLEQGMAMQERKRAKEQQEALQGMQEQDKLLKEANAIPSTGVQSIDEYKNKILSSSVQSLAEAEKKKGSPLNALEVSTVLKPLQTLPNVVRDYNTFDKDLETSLAQVSKLTDFVDIPRLKQDIVSKVISTDEKGTPVFNRDAGLNYLMEVTQNPDLQSSYANPSVVANDLDKKVNELFKPQKIDVTTPQEEKRGFRTYHNLIPDVTRIDREGKNAELNTETIKIGEEQIPALAPEAYEAYTRIPAAKVEINLMKRELAGKYRGFTDLPEEDKNRIAGLESLKKHYKGLGNVEPVERDRSEADRMAEERRYAESLALRRRSVGIAEENLRLRKNENNLTYADLISKALTGDPVARSSFATTPNGGLILDTPIGEEYMLGDTPVQLIAYEDKTRPGKNTFKAFKKEKIDGQWVVKKNAKLIDVSDAQAENMLREKTLPIANRKVRAGGIDITEEEAATPASTFNAGAGMFSNLDRSLQNIKKSIPTTPATTPAAKAPVNAPLSNSGKEYINRLKTISTDDSEL